VEKTPLKQSWQVARVFIWLFVILALVVAFFFTYNTYLIDTSLENLKFSLSKVSAARTIEETRDLKMVLGEALIKEVSAEKLDTASVVNLEFGQNIIAEAKIKDQLKDLRTILTSVVKSKEAKRSKVLLALDALNEKVRRAMVWVQFRIRGKAKPGVEVKDTALLDKARESEAAWQMEDAIASYNAFISQYPDYKDIGWVRLRLGYANLKMGELKRAEKIFSEVANSYLGSEETLVARRFLVTINNIKRSLKEKDVLLNKLAAAKTEIERQKIYYDIGVIDTYNYNLGSARDFFRKAIEIDPKSLLAQKAQFNIGWSLKFQNDLEKSALVFEDVINIYAKGDIVLNAKYQLADAYHKGGKYEEAIKIYKKIAQDYKDKPIAPLAQFQAGYSYLYNMNDPIQASDAFKELNSEFKSSALASYASLDLVPSLESRFRDFAFSLLMEGKYDKAREAFVKAIEVNAKDAWAHGGLGSSHTKLGNIRDGVLETRTSIQILPDEYTYSALGFCLEMEGKAKDAIEAYKKAVEKNKNFMPARNNMGRLYEMEARYDEAIAEYKEVLRIDPNYSCGWNNLGHAYWIKGEALLAIEAFRKATDLKPSCVEAHYNLGLALNVLRREEEAIMELKAALKIMPDLKEARDELERIAGGAARI